MKTLDQERRHLDWLLEPARLDYLNAANGTYYDPERLRLSIARCRARIARLDKEARFVAAATNRRPRILDLFCGAGGAAMGYHRAGFEVVGVDREDQKRYPFRFIRDDALEFLTMAGHKFHAIHASPPCQKFSRSARCNGRTSTHPDLLTPVREILEGLARPWVIENVPGAPMRHCIELCGLAFNLKVFRHRLFESSVFLLAPAHPSHGVKRIGVDGMCSVHGQGGHSPGNWRSAEHRHYEHKAAWAAAMGIDWMTRDELSQAIPPAYTEFIGRQLLAAITTGE